MGAIAIDDDSGPVIDAFRSIEALDAPALLKLMDFAIATRDSVD